MAIDGQEAPFFSRMIEGRSTVIMPPDSTFINQSANTSFFREHINKGISLKYVCAGTEHYLVNGKRHAVTEGIFLVVGHGSETAVEITARKPVEGLCIYLNSGLVADVWHVLQQCPDDLVDNQPRQNKLPDFYEQVFQARYNSLGQEITRLASTLATDKAASGKLDKEVFYQLAYKLCRLQQQNLKGLAALPSQKKVTREELFKRLLTARDFMHDSIGSTISLDIIAREAGLSEFHFLRTFKAVFGQSPYQYLLQLRLQKARHLLQLGVLPVSQVALDCGFKEVQAFSKIFGRQEGISPSGYQQASQKKQFYTGTKEA